MSFPSVDLQGNVLSAEVLDLIARGEAEGQKPANFGLPTDSTVDRAVGEAWAAARTYWKAFAEKRAKLKDDESGVTITRRNWVTLLLGELGYELETAEPEVLNDKPYPISHRATNQGGLPVHIMGVHDGMDKRRESGRPRLSPHALLQEYLNHSEHVYGLVTNGLHLRLLRDSVRLGRPAYVEFNLERILDEEIYPDFAALYRALHATRMPISIEDTAESLIEKYHVQGIESGTRIREQLEGAVKNAIETLANGLFANNPALAEAAVRGEVTAAGYYHVLLRTVYRMLFLIVIEERDLVHPVPQGPEDPVGHLRDIYRRYYSFGRLRKLALRAAYVDGQKSDIWRSMLSTFCLFERQGKGAALCIAPLGSELFGTPLSAGAYDLHDLELDNKRVLEILKGLLLTKNAQGTLVPVNYAGLNVEEFGSVYEGLLDLEPVIDPSTQKPVFGFRQGDERSNTGSHYTPDILVQPLIKHSLDHLIADKLKEVNKEKALLSLRVADISCGSGHILLAAARRIATELAIVRTGMEQPRAADFRVAMRDVIRHCIYGVDLNPLAVELCKVALWLEAHIPGEPLNFLDHRIKCGNAIVGFAHREELDRGVPDEAFATLPGDDKDVAAAFRKRNKQERQTQGQTSLDLSADVEAEVNKVVAAYKLFEGMPERTPAEIEAKQRRFQEAMQADAYRLNQVAAIPIAQFYIPKSSATKDQLITDATYRSYWTKGRQLLGPAPAMAWATAERKRFFHWFIEFPEVMAAGGFDCILGNPPYLGSQALTGTYGHEFGHFVKWEYAPTGLSDLVVYFLRRIYKLMNEGGYTAFITTNSIKDGDNRRDGLEQVMNQGGEINMAVRGRRWPGLANVVVSLLSIHKGPYVGKHFLDEKEVSFINAFLEEGARVDDPAICAENVDQLFQGSIFLGDGFLLSKDEAEHLLLKDPRNEDVIHKVINGRDTNSSAHQDSERYIINFFDWSEEKASTYSGPFEIVKKRVIPERQAQKNDGAKKYWWRYYRFNKAGHDAIGLLPQCFVTARVTKHLSFSAQPTDRIFTNNLYVFTTDRWDLFATVQSGLHEVWGRKYSMSLKQDLQYSPTDCFVTFPFPAGQWQRPNAALAALGERYHEHRKQLMRHSWRGLTDVYNLFHSKPLRTATPEELALPDKDFEKLLGKDARLLRKHLQDPKAPADVEVWPFNRVVEGVLRLRQLHVELDNAVRDAYGWQDLDLQHAFYDVDTLPENDRTRYTISPAARKEVLKRLLALNHERRAEEEAKGLWDKKGKAVKGKKKKKSEGNVVNEPPGSYGMFPTDE